MQPSKRKRIIVGNWKSNYTSDEASNFITEHLNNLIVDSN